MKNHFWKTGAQALALVGLVCLMSNNAYASGSFGNSTIAVGLKNLVSDVTTWLVVLCPIAGGAAGVFCMIRRAMADEQEGRVWTKRAKTAIFCGVGGMLVSGIITMLASYF